MGDNGSPMAQEGAPTARIFLFLPSLPRLRLRHLSPRRARGESVLGHPSHLVSVATPAGATCTVRTRAHPQKPRTNMRHVQIPVANQQVATKPQSATIPTPKGR